MDDVQFGILKQSDFATLFQLVELNAINVSQVVKYDKSFFSKFQRRKRLSIFMNVKIFDSQTEKRF